MIKSLKSLLITTSNNRLGDAKNKTGVWLEDLAAPYYILKDAGEFITIVSPLGGEIPLDPRSEFAASTTENTVRFQDDAQAMYHLSHSLPIYEVKPQNFDLLFIAGGYGAMCDFPGNIALKRTLEHFIANDKPIGLVGHGVVALVSLIGNNGDPFVKGRKLTAFSDSEEALALLNEKSPFLLESRLQSLGALYSKAADFTSHIVVDGNIITGQNPASAVETAKQLLALAQQIQSNKNALVY